MRVLIIGVGGQLGQDCLKVLQSRHETAGVDLPEFDITDKNAINCYLRGACPEVVINKLNRNIINV